MASNSKPLFANFSASSIDFSFDTPRLPRQRDTVKTSVKTSAKTPDQKRQSSIFNFANTKFISNSSDSTLFGTPSGYAEPPHTPIPQTPITTPIFAMDALTKSVAAMQVPSVVSSSSASLTDKTNVTSSEGDGSGTSQDESSSGEEGGSIPSQSERPSQVLPARSVRSMANKAPTNKSPATKKPDSNPAATLEAMRVSHLRLLEHHPGQDELSEIKTTPIFTEAVRQYAHTINGSAAASPFSQYGLLAGDISGESEQDSDKRVFWNISAPSSFFICGSQGSGKSHTLSCLLENALAPCAANQLPRPLTGIVFHYDTFISDTGGSPCEAAWLSSNPDIKVRVLCPPTNIRTMKRMYSKFPRIVVEELRLNEADLNTKRMLDLMAVTSGGMPLYLHVVNRILRELRVSQQRAGGRFSYSAFKRMLQAEQLTDMQLAPLKQRLDTLESFMVEDQAKAFDMFSPQRGGTPKKKQTAIQAGTNWTPCSGGLTIVDLSCPCVTAEMACSLFNICLSLFLEQPCDTVGRIIALDEAHKYMNESAECQTLTEALLGTIRLQRHLGARVVISTQEPTISPKLLDLCSVTVVHRFTSPDWLNALRKHLAGVSSGARLLNQAQKTQVGVDDEGEMDGVGALSLGDGDPGVELFSRIVALRVGEALLFAPSAVVGVQKTARESGGKDVKRLAHGVMKVRVRNRTTADGGRSVMAF